MKRPDNMHSAVLFASSTKQYIHSFILGVCLNFFLVIGNLSESDLAWLHIFCFYFCEHTETRRRTLFPLLFSAYFLTFFLLTFVQRIERLI